MQELEPEIAQSESLLAGVLRRPDPANMQYPDNAYFVNQKLLLGFVLLGLVAMLNY